MKKFRRSDRLECAMLSGLVCGTVCGAGVLVWYLPLLIAPVLCFLFRKYALAVFLCSVAVGFNLAFYFSSDYDKKADKIADKNYAYGSFVLHLKDARQCNVKNIDKPAMISAELVSIRLSGKNEESCSYNVMVKLPADMSDPGYGAIISGRGSIASSRDPGFANYLKARDIVKCIYLKEAAVIGKEKTVYGKILSVRDKVASRVLEKMDNDNSRNLAAALFFGMTGGLNQERRSAYVNTGTIHVFSVSGMHVAILAYFLFLLFRFFGMRAGYCLTLLITGAYVLSTGASAPAVRAYFMLFIWGMTRMCFLWMSPFSVFCWAASFLILLNPLLVLDVGARYSVVITGVLIATSENLSLASRLERIRKKYIVPGGRVEKTTVWEIWAKKFRFALWICVAAFFGGLAISLYHNGQFLLFSIPVNLMLSPFMSAFYLLLGISMAVPDCAFLLSGAFQILQSFCSYAEKLSYNLPAASPGEAGMWLYIALLFVFIRYNGKIRLCSGILLAALVLRWILLPFAFPTETVIYNSVKRPACVLFADSSRNSAIVVDPSSSAAAAEISRHLRSRGITKIEGVIFSRNSAYTAYGVRTLMRNFNVEKFYLPEIKKYERWKKFYEYLDRCGIEKGSRVIGTHKKLKIIRQKRDVTLEYFKRCAKLKDVLILKELSDGRHFEIIQHGKRIISGFMPFDRRERIYHYEFGK